jgi:hypothetical protein
VAAVSLPAVGLDADNRGYRTSATMIAVNLEFIVGMVTAPAAALNHAQQLQASTTQRQESATCTAPSPLRAHPLVPSILANTLHISADCSVPLCCNLPRKRVLQLERCVEMDSALEPVLRWKPVNAARLIVAGAAANRGRPVAGSSSSSRAGKPGARVACASTAGGGCTGGGSVSGDGQSSSCMSSM